MSCPGSGEEATGPMRLAVNSMGVQVRCTVCGRWCNLTPTKGRVRGHERLAPASLRDSLP